MGERQRFDAHGNEKGRNTSASTARQRQCQGVGNA